MSSSPDQPASVSPGWPAPSRSRPVALATPRSIYVSLDSWSDLALARGDGRYAKLLDTFAKTDLLVIDDFGLTKLSGDNQRDLLEILEDRYASRSTLVTSQLPLEEWHAIIDNPTFADAILDRLVHNAYKLNLKGDSLRKNKSNLTQPDHSNP